MKMIGQVMNIVLPAAVIVGLVYALNGHDLNQLLVILADADPMWLVVAALANVVSQISRALGWNVMLDRRRPIRFARLVRIEFAVEATAAVTPEAVGELIRLGYLSHEDVPRSVTLTIVFVRKFFPTSGWSPS